MAVLLKRQLSDSEKQQILAQHGRTCFATGHEIPEVEQLQFDHIRAFARDGASELDNIAPMCAQHNKEKGALPLDDFRIKLRLKDFFATGDRLTLGDLLDYMKKNRDLPCYGSPISVKENDGTAQITSPSFTATQPLHTCKTTGWKYFYATLDIALLDSDDDHDETVGLQPRYLIFDKVFNLYRHFQKHPVLQPSVGRIVDDRIRLFDGQHKIAALLWNGRRQFECKVYLRPDVRLLNDTNIAAHDKFAQTPFFSSIMVMKLGAQFGADFERYKNLEDGQPKTEASFMDYLRKQDSNLNTAELNQRFRSYLYNSVLEHEENRLRHLVSASNRGSMEKPLTIDQLSKSFFSCFMYRNPTTDNMTTDAYARDQELQNMVEFMNAFYDIGLSKWNPKASPNDEQQRKLNRLAGSKSMMAWAELMHGAVCGKLEIYGNEDRVRPFYRLLTPQQNESIRNAVQRLVDWKMWVAPASDEIDAALAGNKSQLKEWFKKKGLTTGYLMGAPE